jgi:hypothetical protein
MSEDDDAASASAQPKRTRANATASASPLNESEQQKWRTARYVTQLVLENVGPLLETAVVSAVRELRYNNQSYLPGFITSRLADPFIALRNCVDASLIFEKSVAHLSEKLMQQAVPASPRPTGTSTPSDIKKLSLRRSLTARNVKAQQQSVNTEPSTSSSSTDDTSAQVVLDEERRLARIVTAEAERVASRLSKVTDVFVDRLCRLVNIRDGQTKLDLLQFTPYTLLHPSVARHPNLRRLKLGDSTILLAVARAYVREFILLETFAQAYLIENAERRCAAVERQADEWVAEQFAPAVVADMLPVDWFLDEQTHEPLEDTVLDERRAAMRRELPFLIIGVLHLMRLTAERDLVVWSLYQKIV